MKQLITITIFLALLVSVSAEMDIITYSTANGFTAYSPSIEISLCQCEPFTDTVLITNTGAYAARYTLATDIDVTVSEANFEINPGKSKTIQVFFQSPCDEEISTGFIYEIVDVFGNVQVIDKTLEITECDNLQATLLTNIEGQSIGPCEEVTYTVEVQNTGVFTETYDVEFGGEDYLEFFDKPSQSIMIPQGETGVLSSTLDFDCGVHGNFTIPFTVESRQNQHVAEFTHKLVIEQDYPYSIGVVEDEVCALDTTRIPVVISNDGDLDNEFALSIKGPDFLSLEESYFLLDEGDETQTYILVEPGQDDVGELSFTIEGMSMYGGVAKSIDVNTSVKSCHQIGVTIVRDDDINECAGYFEIPILIENMGFVDEIVNVSAQGAYVWVDEPVVYVEEQGSYELNLVFNTTETVETVVTVTATLASGLSAQDTIKASFMSQYDCRRINLVDSTHKVLRGTKEFWLDIRNDGMVAGNYELMYSGDGRVTLSNESESLWLDAGTSNPVKFNLDEKGTAKINGALHVKGETGSYDLDFTLETVKKSIFVRAYDFFSVHKCNLISIILIILLIIAALFLALWKGVSQHNLLLLIIFLVVWLIIIVIAYSVYGAPPALYESLPESEDPLEFVIAENDKLVINASEYFLDPDNDNLTFNVDELDDVHVVVDGSKITMMPEKGWSGTKRFRLIADDGEENVRSPRMYLDVIDRPKYSLFDIYNRYCVTVNAFLLLGLFILVYFLAVRRKRTPAEKGAQTRKRNARRKK